MNTGASPDRNIIQLSPQPSMISAVHNLAMCPPLGILKGLESRSVCVTSGDPLTFPNSKN